MAFLKKRFPEDEELCVRWLSAMKETHVIKSCIAIQELWLCFVHFEEECFDFNRLKDDAIPSKFLIDQGAGPPPLLPIDSFNLKPKIKVYKF